MSGARMVLGEVAVRAPASHAHTELIDAQHAFDVALATWHEHTLDEFVAVAKRWWIARKNLRDALMGRD